ncbi:MAG: tetratricopeptide repeat protein [Gemmatimonadetes bacterium]|nr:tetratricopeptide repeat protein [Gemmatimonadota bacterium]
MKDQVDKAIAVYAEIVRNLEGTPEMDAELALYNKLGDLYLKKNSVNDAVEIYEKAARRYTETGFPNNSIALYNKILRSAPGRTEAYLELGKLMIERRFTPEAKKHFREYVERMDKNGKTDYAFDALKKFADSSANTEDTRVTVAELLEEMAKTDDAREQLAKLYAEAESEGDERKVRRTLEKMKAIDPDFKPEAHETADAGASKSVPGSSDIVFLDFDAVEEPAAEDSPAAVETEAAAVEGIETTAVEGLGAQEEVAVGGDDLQLERSGVEEGLDLEPSGAARESTALDLSLTDEDIDLALDMPEDLEKPGAVAASEGAPTLEELQNAVSANPENPATRRELAEALIENGDRQRGIEELDAAMQGFQSAKDWNHALACADLVLRLDPNNIEHHQKKVEFVSHVEDKPRLVTAYLAFADALVREGDMAQARSAYLSVLEHDPVNAEANSALETVVPAPEPQAVATPESGDFVDLAALILDDEDEPADKSSRMRTRDSMVSSGDEQADFSAVLSEFKKGIEENIAEDDSEAHYDLGVAFKEMGLLDEAIAEFQKALRGSQARLKTAEALGMCFFEKGQHSVAATVLKRAIDSDEGTDDDKIGMLYWAGRCEEEQGNGESARNYYQRVFAVDIQFEDVGDRVANLA